MYGKKTIRARATVNLPNLRAGETADVDPTQPYVAACLRRRLLIPLDEPRPPTRTTTAPSQTAAETVTQHEGGNADDAPGEREQPPDTPDA